MKNLKVLFKKDIITVLIVLVSLLLVAAFLATLYLIFKTPSAASIASELFPTKTLQFKAILTNAALTREAMASAPSAPTITTMPLTPNASVLTLSPELPSATQELQLPLQPTRTPVQLTSTVVVLTQTQGATLSNSAGSACIPGNNSQAAKVVEIVDGNTVRVLINGLVYTVRYIGIAVPASPVYARAATFANGKLAFAKEVMLIQDKTDKDEAGRLLRYVKAGDTFVNLELLKQGLGVAADTPPNSSCAQVFAGAEQKARQSQVGQWSATPTP